MEATIKISAAGVVALTSGVFSGDISAATGKYLESYIAGEDVTQGQAASVVGYITENSTVAMLTDDAQPTENLPDTVVGDSATAIYVEAYAGQRKYAMYKFNLSDLTTKEDEPQKEIISVKLHIKCTYTNSTP